MSTYWGYIPFLHPDIQTIFSPRVLDALYKYILEEKSITIEDVEMQFSCPTEFTFDKECLEVLIRSGNFTTLVKITIFSSGLVGLRDNDVNPDDESQKSDNFTDMMDTIFELLIENIHSSYGSFAFKNQEHRQSIKFLKLVESEDKKTALKILFGSIIYNCERCIDNFNLLYSLNDQNLIIHDYTIICNMLTYGNCFLNQFYDELGNVREGYRRALTNCEKYFEYRYRAVKGQSEKTMNGLVKKMNIDVLLMNILSVFTGFFAGSLFADILSSTSMAVKIIVLAISGTIMTACVAKIGIPALKSEDFRPPKKFV